MSASEVYAPADDQAAFAEVYRAHHAKLLRFCQYRLRDRHEAEDVAQEAFARAWRSMPTTAFDRNFYPWLRVVASNLCTDVLRKRSRSQPVATMEIGSVDGDMDRITEEADHLLVRQALGRLNDRHRSALMMREDEGLTYDQIAARTGVTTATVESLLWRARQALKREFTVLADRAGCFAILPVAAAAMARVRSAPRRAWARLVGFDSQNSSVSVAHVAMAAIAALTVASGVVATMGMGGRHGSGPGLVVPDQAGSASPAAHPAAAQTAGSPSSTAGSRSTPSPTVQTEGSTLPAAPAGAGRSNSSHGSFRIIDPVTTGPSTVRYASQAPVQVSVGSLVIVGAAPSAIGAYVNRVVSHVQAVVPTVTTPTLPTLTPGK